MFDIVLVVIGNQIELFDLSTRNDDLVSRCESTYNTVGLFNATTLTNSTLGTSPPSNCGDSESDSAKHALLTISAMEICLFVIFLLEHVGMVLSLQKKYFKNIFLILDFIAVVSPTVLVERGGGRSVLFPGLTWRRKSCGLTCVLQPTTCT